MKQALGIVSMCIVAAVLYGIAHDQITARTAERGCPQRSARRGR